MRMLTLSTADPANDHANELTDDTQSDEGYTGFFEGPEKTMEVKFRIKTGVDDGLRAMTRTQLDHLCALAKCSILSKISSSHLDAYVLSESSLFVYKYKYIMKTCGTTTLLRCLNTLLAYADDLDMIVESVTYSRKNLICPTAQLWPHSSFGDEIKYINNHAKLQERLHGNGYILGPVTGDHWFVYVADLAPPAQIPAAITNSSLTTSLSALSFLHNRPTAAPTAPLNVITVRGNKVKECTLNMMMFGLAADMCQIFFKKNVETGKEMTKLSGICDLCPGATIDETAFTPCGYSMNAILHDSYYTIHITPEDACSYASFETNNSISNYSPLVRNALKVFRPKRFVITMLADDDSIFSMPEVPTDLRRVELPGLGNYVRTSMSSTKVEAEQCCMMACFCLEEVAPVTMKDLSAKTAALMTQATAAAGGDGTVHMGEHLTGYPNVPVYSTNQQKRIRGYSSIN